MGNLLKVLTCTDLEQEPNFFLDFESMFLAGGLIYYNPIYTLELPIILILAVPILTSPHPQRLQNLIYFPFASSSLLLAMLLS